MQQIISKYNAPPTIIVNAAGILKDNFLLKLDEEMFDDVIKINLKVFSIESVFFFIFDRDHFNLTYYFQCREHFLLCNLLQML